MFINKQLRKIVVEITNPKHYIVICMIFIENNVSFELQSVKKNCLFFDFGWVFINFFNTFFNTYYIEDKYYDFSKKFNEVVKFSIIS